MEGFETDCSEEAGCCPDQGKQELPGDSLDVSNVSMVRKLRVVTLCKRKKNLGRLRTWVV